MKCKFLIFLTVENQLPDFLKVLYAFGVIVVVWTASPKSLVVELDSFAVDTSEHHGAHAGVADRESLDPLLCGLGIPKFEVVSGVGRHDTEESEDGDYEKFAKEQEAEKLIDQYYMTPHHGMCYLTLGSLFINFNHSSEATDYRRELDIANAVSDVSYKIGDVSYNRQTIASLPNGVIMVNLTADRKKALNISLEYETPEGGSVKMISKGMDITVPGREHEGIPAGLTAKCGIRVKSNGKVFAKEGMLNVQDADYAVIYIASATNYVNYHDISGNPDKIVADLLKNAMKSDFSKSLASHTEAYKQQFDRVSLSLPSNGASDKETHLRVADFKNNYDPSLLALLFQYGRYLLISSSQPGGQPANLQGVWNESNYAPWDSKYTININAEMNYWPAEVTNLSECHEPTGFWILHHRRHVEIGGSLDYRIVFLKEILVTGKEIMVVEMSSKPSATVRPHAISGHVDGTADSPGIGVVMSYPAITAGCTMDNQIAYDALNNTLKCAEILGEDAQYLARLQNTIAKLQPMKVGRYGQLQEWAITTTGIVDRS